MKSLSTLLTLGALVIASLAATAQTSETFTFDNFERVSVNAGIDAVIEYGSDHKVVLTGSKSDLDKVEVELDGKTLKLNLESSWFSWGGSDIEAVITLTRLSGVVANGGADVTSSYRWQADDFTATSNGGADLVINVDASKIKATSNGGADLTMDINAKSVEAKSNGGADLKLTGNVGHADLSANGGADVDAAKLICRTAEASANGAGDVVVHASESIKARANGGSDVKYYGNPPKVDAKSNGGSDVTRG